MPSPRRFVNSVFASRSLSMSRDTLREPAAAGPCRADSAHLSRSQRTIQLPVSVDAGKVEARLDNGVLTIKMAKSPAAKPKKIPVEAGEIPQRSKSPAVARRFCLLVPPRNQSCHF